MIERGDDRMKKQIVILFALCLGMIGYLVYEKLSREGPTGLGEVLEMAEGVGTKISALTEMTDHPQEDDELVVVDSTPTATTKRILPRNLFRYDIIDKTANYTVLRADGHKVITNNDTSADIECDLPECVASPGAGQVGPGWNVIFYVLESGYKITVDPHANDSIADFASGNDAGDHIYSDTTIGSCIKLVCMNGDVIGDETDAYNFYSFGYVGTWTAED